MANYRRTHINEVKRKFLFTFQSSKSNLKTKWLYATSPDVTKCDSGAFLGAENAKGERTISHLRN